MLNKKFTFCFKITIKLNLTKSHGTRLKSAKNQAHVIKEHLLKLMRYNQINHIITAYHMVNLCSLAIKKVPKVKAACSYSKEDDLY